MLNIKKIVVLYLAGILLLTSVSIISLADPDPIPNTITISYSFSEPEVSDVVINGKQFTRATIDGLENSGLAGEPALPKKTARVLLPPKSSITSIEVIKEGMGVINNIDSIELGPISYHPISNPEV